MPDQARVPLHTDGACNHVCLMFAPYCRACVRYDLCRDAPTTLQCQPGKVTQLEGRAIEGLTVITAVSLFVGHNSLPSRQQPLPELGMTLVLLLQTQHGLQG